MPLTSKGQKIKNAMQQQYGDKKGEQVFYASENAGKLKGIVKGPGRHGKKRRSGRS